jgi:hypothetical protein
LFVSRVFAGRFGNFVWAELVEGADAEWPNVVVGVLAQARPELAIVRIGGVEGRSVRL